MRSFLINQNDSGQRLDKFISKAAPELPKSLMYKYIRLKRIKLNKKRAAISDRLKTGDIVELYINDEFFVGKKQQYDFLKASNSLSIVYQDSNIMLVNKKTGLLCHPDDKEYGDTLINRILRVLYESGEYNPEDENSFAPSLVNRIDRNTSGIVIAAKNADSLRILNEKMKNREIKKYYLCIVSGIMPKPSDTLTAYHIKNNDKNKAYIYDHKKNGAKTIQTKYRTIMNNGELSLLEVELLTGRTHQIRAHMAFIGHPLLGDGKYGSNSLNRRYQITKQALCSYKLKFDFASDAEGLNYLNQKEFEIENPWFKDHFFSDKTHN